MILREEVEGLEEVVAVVDAMRHLPMIWDIAWWAIFLVEVVELLIVSPEATLGEFSTILFLFFSIAAH